VRKKLHNAFPNWQKKSWQTFEETSGYVRPERVNKWPNSTTDMMIMMMMKNHIAASKKVCSYYNISGTLHYVVKHPFVILEVLKHPLVVLRVPKYPLVALDVLKHPF
jgi:hypothetical protein